MMSQRWRPVILMGVAICAIWIVAIVGYRIAKNSKMTADKVKAYAESVDINKLSGAARAKAIRDLEAMLNSLSAEERQKARFERAARSWFDEMTEDEKTTCLRRFDYAMDAPARFRGNVWFPSALLVVGEVLS